MKHNFNETNTIKISTLANGLTVATDTIPGVFTASLGVWVAVGSRHEQENEHGISHFFEHMAFKGTKRRSAYQIAEDIENVGGDINAATSIEFTSYTARVLGEHVPLAMDVLSDILNNSVFLPHELKKEKSVIFQEYAAVEDTPDDLIYDIFMETAFPKQPLGRPILGTPDTLKNMDGDTIRSFLEREYTPNRMVLAASGAVDHNQIVDLAEKTFGSRVIKDAATYTKGHYEGGERRIQRKLEQVNIVIGFPGCGYKDRNNYAIQLFSQILGGGLTSRLWREVREQRGLAYSIDAFHWPFSDCGVFGIGAGTSEEDVPKLLDITLKTARQATKDIDAKELERAKAQTKVGLLAALESPAGRIERIARQLLAWQRVIPSQEIVDKIDALTVEDIREAGRSILEGVPTLTAIGSLKKMPSHEIIFMKGSNPIEKII